MVSSGEGIDIMMVRGHHVWRHKCRYRRGGLILVHDLL